MTHRFKNRLTQLFALSLILNFLSLKLLPTFRQILAKTLDFLKMDTLIFSADSGDEDSIFGTTTAKKILSLSDLEDERLYLVDHRWWNATRESLFKEMDGVLFATSSCLVDDFESELIFDMRRNESDTDDRGGEEQGVSGREYALVSEWMFYRALKWHHDMKNADNFLAVEDNKPDLFSLKVWLSISGTTNSLAVRISQKGNGIGAFNKSCQIFCVKSGLLKIWDFSGQITKFFLQGGTVSDNSEQVNEEISLELHVYGLYNDVMQKENKMEIEDSKTEGFSSSNSLNMNGHANNVNSHVGYDLTPRTSSFSGACSLGFTGLYNLGNTCFMNSAIQCLVHTPQLLDYFLGDFRKDLNFHNPLGMNGKLALAFGDLLRQLWTPGVTAVGPRAFKSRLADFAPQFSGYNQHDSQEFLSFLLDGLHEDLNRVKIKPYYEIKDVEGVSDKDVADEHWRNHLARNDSIIVDTCQGQYRSTLICPHCTKHSVTFDPFIYVSLPLPSTTMRTMTLTILSTDGSTLPIPVTVTVPKYGKFKDLIQALSIAISLGEDETLLVAEIYNNCILHFLDKPGDSLELVRDDDRLVAYRLRKDEDSLPLIVFTHTRYESPFNQGSPSSNSRKFGIPLVARIPESINGLQVHKIFLKLLNPLELPDEILFEENNETVKTVDHDTEMVVEVADEDSFTDSLLNSEVDCKTSVKDYFEFHLEQVGYFSEGTQIVTDETLLIPESGRVSVTVLWPEEMIKKYDTSILSQIPETGGISVVTKKPPESFSLYKCLEAFLKEEPLGPDDMWFCPRCTKPRQASKKLDLWRLPEILIIHLKRFSYNRYLKDKLETFVDFPIDEIDLTSYTVHKDNGSTFRYKLYAVINHYGGMGGGHYTAFAQCGAQWYEFNDSQVFLTSENQIKTSAAYVLFYKRI